MKRIVASLLLVAMLLSLVACKETPADPTTETTLSGGEVQPTESVPVEETVGNAELAAAAAALQALYADVDPLTPADYELVGTVTVDGVDYPITWTTDVAEELVKIVDTQDGFYAVDINEMAKEETPYVLTGTITDANGNTVVVSFERTLPVGSGADMAAIVDAAYALGKDEAMTEPVTLTGVITGIVTPWSEDYQNISVNMVVAGREEKPIQCFRLKGEGAKELTIGDTITVTGILKNYNGTVEFDAGCNLDAVVKGENTAPVAPEDPAEIVAAAFALNPGETLPYEATLVGTIVTIDTPWNDQYENITVTMRCEGKRIMCFRLSGYWAEYLSINDRITVQGYLTNYNGTIEFAAGCKLLDVIDRAPPSGPSDPHEIVDAAYALKENQALNYKSTLTGKITKVDTPWSSYYGNITVIIEVEGREDKPIKCFRLKGDGASGLAVGDTITVKGTLKNYNGTVEFDSGCELLNVVKGEGGGETEPVTSQLPPITEVAEGTEYLFGIIQVSNGHTVFVTGVVSGRYLETTQDPAAAAKVCVEAAGEGYKFYILDGENKLYIDAYLNGEGKTSLQYSAEGDVYTFDAATGSWATELDGTAYYIGSYSTFDTLSLSKTSYISAENTGISQFPAGFFPLDYEPPEEPEEPDTPVEPEKPDVSPETGKAYKLGMYQGNVKKTLYITGNTANTAYYLETTEDITAAIDVYVEEVEGGSRLYFTKDGVKTYIDVVVNGTYVNIKLTDAPTAVYTWNEEYKTFVTTVTVGGEQVDYYLGTYGTYDTLSASKLSYAANSFPATLYDPSTETPSEPDTPVEPEGLVPQEGTAYKLSLVQDTLGKTLYFNGATAGKAYYLGTTENAAEAVDAFVEKVDGGYHLFFTKDGVKTYIDIAASGSYVNAGLTETPTAVLRWNDMYKTFVATVGDADYYLGTYESFTTISASDYQYISTSYPVTLTKSETPSEPDTPVESEKPEKPDITPEEGKAYKLGMLQGNVNKTLYITGNTANKDYYLETTEDITAAIDVYVEEVEGGSRLYFTKDGVKTYIDVIVSGTYVNIKLTDAPTAVYTWNEEYKTFVTTVTVGEDQVDYYLGTYNTFETLSASKFSYISTSFPATLYIAE